EIMIPALVQALGPQNSLQKTYTRKPGLDSGITGLLRIKYNGAVGREFGVTDNNDLTVKSSSNGPDSKPEKPGADALIGTLFADKYEIISLLGEGGMSKVYKARHKFMKRIVAVKLLHETGTSDAVARARFQQEAEAASALNHQNVVTVHDFGVTADGHAFFVMDCLEGKSLCEILEETGSLPLTRALDIFTQACDGLEHAHRKGIIHRDIKPSNLVVIEQEDGTELVKLVDFGIAKVIAPVPDGQKQQQLTMAGEIFGTPAYMSPEQCSGTTLDARSDLYSFGCMMYEALSGEPPLLGETFISTVAKHIGEKPRALAEFAHAKVPAHIDAVILKCLEKDPDNRYASAHELKQALFDAAYASGLKGLKVGAVPERKISGVVGSVSASHVSLAEKKVTQKWRRSFTISMTLVLATIVAGITYLFCYPGPAGDQGTPFSKLSWQHYLASADDLEKQGKYQEAIKELLAAKAVTNQISDGRSRYETTLNKLGEVYGLARDYSGQEAINRELVRLANEKVYHEYDNAMNLLKKWEAPSGSSSENEERAQQATAFAERIARLADKLSIRSKEKQELLLKKSIKVYDGMELKDWKWNVRFRNILAECYRQQQRFDDEKTILEQALKFCPATPSKLEGWRLKLQTEMMLGQLERDQAINDSLLDAARTHLESVLSLIRENLPADKEFLRDSLNSVVINYRLYHKPDYDKKAAEYEKEARSLESKLDSEAEQQP
ncbi:MAG: protein kinase, partial [Candidatus Obscuribacterales bacterium]|nr:protein kinase [Candidatus Obscuribacterales bacterium]